MSGNLYSWIEKSVNQDQEHIKLFYKDSTNCIALISSPVHNVFNVEFITNDENQQTRKIIEEVKKEINFYLINKKEKYPWNYAKYHCVSTSNLYSPIHWHFYPTINDRAMTFYNILKLYKLDTTRIRLVRHGNAEIPILETFRNNRGRFEAYQSLQAPKKFSNAKQIAVFSPYRNTLSLFLGLWDVKDYVDNKNFTKSLHSIIDVNSFPKKWHSFVCWYNLEHNPILDELSERLVIDWGKSTLSWVQAKDKLVVEIKGKNSLGDFSSFDQVILTFRELKMLINNPDSNTTWINTLSSVNGIYLIKDTLTGRLYVGSAYGAKGIFGRWQSYANSGHGGNKELQGMDYNLFEFSILEILPATTSADEVILRENRWKRKLGTKETGLNLN